MVIAFNALCTNSASWLSRCPGALDSLSTALAFSVASISCSRVQRCRCLYDKSVHVLLSKCLVVTSISASRWRPSSDVTAFCSARRTCSCVGRLFVWDDIVQEQAFTMSGASNNVYGRKRCHGLPCSMVRGSIYVFSLSRRQIGESAMGACSVLPISH